MRVADSSALFALFSSDDEHHEKSKEFIRQGERFVIPGEIMSETLCLVELRCGAKAAREAAAFLRKLGQAEFHPTTDDHWEDVIGKAWTIFLETPGRLSHADAIVAAWSKKRRIKPWTYDKALERYTKSFA